MFLNSSSDMAGFYGTEGKGRNRDKSIYENFTKEKINKRNNIFEKLS